MENYKETQDKIYTSYYKIITNAFQVNNLQNQNLKNKENEKKKIYYN